VLLVVVMPRPSSTLMMSSSYIFVVILDELRRVHFAVVWFYIIVAQVHGTPKMSNVVDVETRKFVVLISVGCQG